jgi:hypothetical protein
MTKLTRQQNERLANLMLCETWSEKRAREDAHRSMEPGEQPYMVVCFGILSYRVIEVCDTRHHAECSLAVWQEHARRGGLAVPHLTDDVSPHDFQVRQQWDLDALVAAILDTKSGVR